MIIKSIKVENFRSILDETLCFDSLTALVGANGSGKSSFLHAFELFETKKPNITKDDFYNKDTGKEIVFSVTFTDLPEDEPQFKGYIQNKELTVERVFKFVDDGEIINAHYGYILQNEDFSEFRKYDKAKDARPEYEALRQNQKYRSLPDWENHDKAKKNLIEWEEDNPKECERIRNDEKFLGYQGVGTGCLEKYIKFLHVPAVRDVSLDATDGKNSALATLLDRVIRKKLSKKENVQKFEKNFEENYKKIIDDDEEILELSKEITESLDGYVHGAKIKLSWSDLQDYKMPLPTAIAKLVEDGYDATVERTGHGLQRIFIMTLLEHLSKINGDDDAESVSTTNRRTLVLIIDEPELYQHPNRQRHLSEIFHNLSKCTKKNTSSKMQIVYSTHSPHFVGLDRINQIRLLRKENNVSELPKITKISTTSIKKLVKELSKYHGDRFTENNIEPRLHMIQTPLINEGFFSKCAVLVEGNSDRAAILSTSKILGKDLESNDVSVIPCLAKGNLDKVAVIFKQLKIPTYVIWDNDRDKPANKRINKTLLKSLGCDEEDYPTHIKDDHAVIEGDLEIMLEMEIGDSYDKLLCKYAWEYDLDEAKAGKNPVVIKSILKESYKCNKKIPDTLEQILEEIEKLSNNIKN